MSQSKKKRTVDEADPSLAMKRRNREEPVETDDEAEFAGLMERQWRFACKVAWAVLHNVADAEDAAQEVFLNLLRTGDWHDLRDERAFVARTAWRSAVDRLRQRRPITDPVLLEEEMAGADAGPETAVIAEDCERAVRGLIESLPEELRQPLVLSAELTSREVAAAMGLPEGTVRRRLMRARELLREKMAALEVRRYARG